MSENMRDMTLNLIVNSQVNKIKEFNKNLKDTKASIDNVSQKIIKNSIDELAKNHTVLIVAHRLSTIIDADEIFVISGGKVIDHGTHESLMKTCSYYQKLHTVEDKIV